MNIVKFNFDEKRDIENIWKAVNSKSNLTDFSKNIRPELVYLAKKWNFEESSQYLSNFNRALYDSNLIQEFPFILEKSWEKIEPHFIKRIERITGQKFERETVEGYVTTISKCPYNPHESWFMISLFNSIPGCMLTTAHELFHLHIHDHFFEGLKLDVGEEKAHDIKEAITTSILNTEFRDLWAIEDKGHEKHKELRNLIEQEWSDNHDFDMLLDKCIKFLKKN